MRVVASSTLREYVRNRVPASRQRLALVHLKEWLARVEHGSWQSSAELKLSFGSASILTAERVVFNIKGNDYRLVTAIDYSHQMVLIKWLGTHAEYDEIDAKVVKFQKERYDNSRDSN